MISFRKVTIKNFRAYKDVTIEFSSDKGVFLMSGENNAGKSTFLNAINWCLYGDTPFYTTENIKEVVNNHVSDDALASVELIADIRGTRFRFYRTTRRGQPGGVPTVSSEENGNWTDLNNIYAEDAVKRILPKDLRHLFFFNGEQLKNIFTKSSNENDLKFSIYKVSGLNIIDNAIRHLSAVEELYFKQLKKQSHQANKIQELTEKKEDLESRIEGHDIAINDLREKVKRKEQRRNELDKLIKDTAEARFLLEKRDGLEDRIKTLKAEIDDLAYIKADVIHKNFHRAILHHDFEHYTQSLIEASRQGVLPPPINPAETAKILKTGICSVCEHHISDEERSRIESKHTEYARLIELQYLIDGVGVFDTVSQDLSERVRDEYRTAIMKIGSKRAEKTKLEEDKKKVNESLRGIDEAQMHDNPQMSRTHIEDRIQQLNLQIGFDARNKDILTQALKKVEAELHRAAQQSPEMQHYDDLRLKAQYLKTKLADAKLIMEESIRQKLQKSLWDVFSKIFSHTNFTAITIDSDYALTLAATDGIRYSTGMLGTGATKVLGLSLAYVLSKDLGYTDVPFLIDNFYGDIKGTHFDEMTKMISSLAEDKQIIIMDLNIDDTVRGFNDDTLAQMFEIERIAETNETTIREVSYGSK